MSERQLSFGRYVIDLARGGLLSDGRDIPLRPKSFEVLTYLAARPAQWVPKEELLEALWPGLIGADDALEQSIAELRRVLTGAEGSLITADPARGYCFDPEAALPERRHPAGIKKAFRWRWMYGLIAPLVLFAAFVAIWFVTSRTGPARAAPEIKPAIAILPFQDQGEEAGREYFADGFTQDLIDSLGRYSGLIVVTWNAVSTYKGAVAQPGEIARVLNVRYQVEGSIRHDADRVHIGAQLVDVQGRVLWSSRFDEPAAELFALRRRIVDEIARALSKDATEVPAQPSADRVTTNREAHDLVLQARPHLREPTRAGLAEARQLLRQALVLDPDYAAAHAALGDSFLAAVRRGWEESPQDSWQRVTAHANDALREDPDNVRARVLLGRMHLAFNRLADAEMELQRAIVLNPNDADALAGYGNALLWRGRVKQAIDSLELAERLDPELDELDRFALALAYYLGGQYPEAIEQGQLNLRENPEATYNLAVLAAAFAMNDRAADAASSAAELRRRDPELNSLLFGTKFQDTRDVDRLRKGLEKAGISLHTRGP